MNLKKRFDPNHDIRFGQAQGPVISAQIWKGNGPKPVPFPRDNPPVKEPTITHVCGR